jgi:AraC-like DNA-binding protein
VTVASRLTSLEDGIQLSRLIMTRTSIYASNASPEPEVGGICFSAYRQRSFCPAPEEGGWPLTNDAGTGTYDCDEIEIYRWQIATPHTEELTCRTDESHFSISVNLKTTNVNLKLCGQSILDGPVTAGMVQITPRNSKASVLFRSSCEVLHLLVPVQTTDDPYGTNHGHVPPDHLWRPDLSVYPDMEIERLARTLNNTPDIVSPLGRLYAKNIAHAIVLRVLERLSTPQPQSRVNRLPLWRLRRALDYIEKNLATPVRLEDIAACVGLTRMHFASQFRLSTGFSPHGYLLRRRIERSEELLRRPSLTVFDVAQRCGFSTHAHFCVVFKRHTGYAPAAWRAQHDLTV